MKHGLWIAAIVLLAGCQPDPMGRSPGEVRSLKAECDADGGRWESGGIGRAMVCYRETPDAGKSCRKASDCTDMCLADTRTCSAESPMFGCRSFLNDKGEVMELCID